MDAFFLDEIWKALASVQFGLRISWAARISKRNRWHSKALTISLSGSKLFPARTAQKLHVLPWTIWGILMDSDGFCIFEMRVGNEGLWNWIYSKRWGWCQKNPFYTGWQLIPPPTGSPTPLGFSRSAWGQAVKESKRTVETWNPTGKNITSLIKRDY